MINERIALSMLFVFCVMEIFMSKVLHYLDGNLARMTLYDDGMIVFKEIGFLKKEQRFSAKDVTDVRYKEPEGLGIWTPGELVLVCGDVSYSAGFGALQNCMSAAKGIYEYVKALLPVEEAEEDSPAASAAVEASAASADAAVETSTASAAVEVSAAASAEGSVESPNENVSGHSIFGMSSGEEADSNFGSSQGPMTREQFEMIKPEMKKIAKIFKSADELETHIVNMCIAVGNIGNMLGDLSQADRNYILSKIDEADEAVDLLASLVDVVNRYYNPLGFWKSEVRSASYSDFRKYYREIFTKYERMCVIYNDVYDMYSTLERHYYVSPQKRKEFVE